MKTARALVLGAVLACGPAAVAPAPGPTAPRPDTFAIDGAALLAKDPHVARKVGRTPYTFFRYQNRAFAERVCNRWASTIPRMPLVHVHGDAHLEQYAVAEGGRGLADFDASGEGPPVIDFARFSASLALARPYDHAGTKAAIAALFRGYSRALIDARATMNEPRVVMRLRERFEPTRLEWLDRMTLLISPSDPADHEVFAQAWRGFVGEMCSLDPSLDEDFFTVKAGGKLELGIGSAHAEKFLARIEGPTSALDDDILLEAKALEPGALASCMRGVDLDATRVIETQLQMSAAPERFLGAMTIRGKPYYTHAWQVFYKELSVDDVHTAAELAELAEDVGLQLGRGHAKSKDAARVPKLRAELLETAKRVEADVVDEAFELAHEVSLAWEQYRLAL
ncbi:MAG: DUF2252 family protein [Labilithrix sp.]|nr:DUF2252 family protein [Labilithrix sp.]MCW5810422.1 DUF2252 family protein [Labilithrix sp.]